MSDKISALAELLTPAADDVLPVVDKSDVSEGASGKLKKIRYDNLIANLTQRAEYADTIVNATTVTLANVADLELTLSAGKTYIFKAILYITADATGGHKYRMAGTATATSIVYQVTSMRNDTDAIVIAGRITDLGTTSLGAAGGTSIQTEIVGTIVVNAGGTLTVQFAQNAANGTSSVVVGSSLQIEQVL